MKITNKSFARSTNFQIHVTRFPDLSFYVSETPIPGLSLEKADAVHADGIHRISDNSITWQPLTLSVFVDEHLKAYRQIYDYFRDYANPQGPREGDEEFSEFDIYISRLNNNKRVVKKAQFIACRPTELSELTYNVQDEKNAHLMVDVTFEYDYMKFIRMNEEVQP